MPGLITPIAISTTPTWTGLMPPQKSFTDWIRLMLATKSGWNYSEMPSPGPGARMLVKTGTTTVADFEAVPELLPDAWSTTPLRVISLLEMTGVKSRRDPRAILLDNVNHIRTLPGGRLPARPGAACTLLHRAGPAEARRRHRAAETLAFVHSRCRVPAGIRHVHERPRCDVRLAAAQ